MNKRWNAAVLAAALISAAAAAGAAAAAAAAAGPRIKFKTESWDFGKVKAGRELNYEFVFKNEGDATLNIKGVESSCGCTAVLLSDRDKKVAPGQSGKIKVTFNTLGYAGEVAKYIFIVSDDASTPRTQLKVTASIDVPPQPRIDLDQYNIDNGLLVEGESFAAEVGVKNRGELELQFECSLPNAAFQVAGRPAAFPVKVAAGKDVLLKVTLPLENRVGPVREFVLIKSNDPLRGTISLTLGGYIVTKTQLKQVFEKYKAILK